MIFALTEDQQMVREMVRKFARERIAPNAFEWNEQRALPASLLDELRELGLMGEASEELDSVTMALVLEELARADASVAMVVAAASTPSAPVLVDEDGANTLGLWAARMRPAPDQDASTTWKLRNAAAAVGVARAALENAVAYAQEREQFGKPIAAYQAIQFKLSDMATAVDAARLLVLEAASDESDATAALRFAANAAVFVTDEAVQIHGGYGYVREYAVERYYRDARWFPIWVGP